MAVLVLPCLLAAAAPPGASIAALQSDLDEIARLIMNAERASVLKIDKLDSEVTCTGSTCDDSDTTCDPTGSNLGCSDGTECRDRTCANLDLGCHPDVNPEWCMRPGWCTETFANTRKLPFDFETCFAPQEGGASSEFINAAAWDANDWKNYCKLRRPSLPNPPAPARPRLSAC